MAFHFVMRDQGNDEINVEKLQDDGSGVRAPSGLNKYLLIKLVFENFITDARSSVTA